MLRSALSAIGIALTIVGAAVADPIELHISATGDDAAAGTATAPFATIQRARDELRQRRAAGGLPAGATVWIAGGRYALAEPIAFGAADSGAPGAPIVYRAADQDAVTISGGVIIDTFTRDADGIAVVDVSGHGFENLYPPDMPFESGGRMAGDAPTFDVYHAGKRQTLARWPNADPAKPHYLNWAYTGWLQPGELSTNRNRLALRDERPLRWRDLGGAQVHFYTLNGWSDQYLPIARVDRERGEIVLDGQARYTLHIGRRYYVRNLREELDAPGEWYFDRERRQLLFVPPKPDEPIAVTVSKSPRLLDVNGASHLEFRGLMLEHSRGDAVTISGGEGVRLIGCTIRQTGGRGVTIEGGQSHTVAGCDLDETGLGGIYVQGGDRQQLIPANHLVLNNHVRRFGRTLQCYQPGVEIRGCGLRIAHNRIHDGPHSGIHYGGNDITIEYNEIFNVALETSDVGAIYTGRDWTYQGNVIRYNRIHDLPGWGVVSRDDRLGAPELGVTKEAQIANLRVGPDERGRIVYGTQHQVWAIYLDDACSDHLIYGNIIYRAGTEGVHVSGQRNTIVNNVFVDAGANIKIGARANFARQTKRLEGMKYREPPYSERYPHLLNALQRPEIPSGNRIARNIFASRSGTQLYHMAHNFPLDSTEVERNLIALDPRTASVWVRPVAAKARETWSLTQWRNSGFDQDSIVADPGFIAPEQDDYRLRSDSPAWALGFEPIPWERIGLQHDETRSTWPGPAQPIEAPVEPFEWELDLGDPWTTRRPRSERQDEEQPVGAVHNTASRHVLRQTEK